MRCQCGKSWPGAQKAQLCELLCLGLLSGQLHIRLEQLVLPLSALLPHRCHVRGTRQLALLPTHSSISAILSSGPRVLSQGRLLLKYWCGRSSFSFVSGEAEIENRLISSFSFFITARPLTATSDLLFCFQFWRDCISGCLHETVILHLIMKNKKLFVSTWVEDAGREKEDFPSVADDVGSFK